MHEHGLRRSFLGPLVPKLLKCRIDVVPLNAEGFVIPFPFQVGHDGGSFFPGEDRQSPERMVIPGHGSIPSRIHEGVPPGRSAVDSPLHRYLNRLLGRKAMGQMKYRIRRLQHSLKIRDQESRQKVAESSFREKTKGRLIRIENRGVYFSPMSHTHEGRGYLCQLASFSAPLKKRITGMFRGTEGCTNQGDHLCFVHIDAAYTIPSRARLLLQSHPLGVDEPIMSRLPIEDVIPALLESLAARPNALLTAPPGAGKTTRVPLALLDAPWLSGKKVLLLEPRRLAARSAAYRMASTLSEPVGATVGYRMKLDTKVGSSTCIEVITEGVLSRLLQGDPSLAPYGIIVFDEFHERSLQADVGLALCLEAQRLFRPDLRLLVMSATLEVTPVAALLGEAPVISSEGRLFPVETRYLDHPSSDRLDGAVVHAIRRSLAKDFGSILVFLPGMAEIRRVERKLLEQVLGAGVIVSPLHGELPQADQDRAIAPTETGTRKVVLATSIAETSLTIDGISIVIDAGLLRLPRFDPRTGLTRLETIRVTQDAADQRRGRSGRLGPGICYRMWTEQEQASLAIRRPPEILDADLASLLLDLAVWGTSDPSQLTWLTPPPIGALAQAKQLLMQLGALDAAGNITDHGRQMASLPMHPRLAHMILRAGAMNLIPLACEIGALLEERDMMKGAPGRRNADLRLRLDVLHGERGDTAGTRVDRGILQRVNRTAKHWQQRADQLILPQERTVRFQSDRAGLLLGLAYPDRIAQRQGETGTRYVLTNGRGALFVSPDPLGSEPYLVIADLDGGQESARIDLAAPITLKEIESLYEDQIVLDDAVTWNEAAKSVKATRRRCLGALTLSEESLSNPDPALVTQALLRGIRQDGLASLAWTQELRQWRARVALLRRTEGADAGWPDLSDEALLDTLEAWLGPFLGGVTTLNRVQKIELAAPLYAILSCEQQRSLDRLAPTHVTVPSGSKIRLDYETADQPVLAVRLQEMFGCKETPRVVNGRVPVMIHLLSPARRPVQVTMDLASFWAKTYQEVRKELRGRYPKHVWPEDPLAALPTAKAKQHTR